MSFSPDFDFHVYRINIVDDEDTFDFYGKRIRTNAEIVEVVRASAKKTFDKDRALPETTHRWSIRDFSEHTLSARGGTVCSITIARSTIEQTGPVVNDSEIATERTHSDRPVAQTMRLFFYLRRHLLIVESNNVLMSTNAWLDHLQHTLHQSAGSLHFASDLRFEPKAKDQEVMEAFRSYATLTRLSVRLRLPNPEVSKEAKELYDRMTKDQIRELLLDMKNPNGVNTSSGSLAQSAAAMSDQGYKDGPTRLEGVKKEWT